MSQDFHNPFETPADRPPEEEGPGLLGQITPLGWCMLAQAGLEFCIGACALVIAGMAMYAFENLPEEIGRNPNMGPAEEAFAVGLYGVVGLLCLSVSLVRLVASIRLLRYQSRMLAFISLGAGVLTTFSGCCAPTSIAICVWGLIVLVNEPVRRAFELRTAGHSKEKVESMLGLYGPPMSEEIERRR